MAAAHSSGFAWLCRGACCRWSIWGFWRGGGGRLSPPTSPSLLLSHYHNVRGLSGSLRDGEKLGLGPCWGARRSPCAQSPQGSMCPHTAQPPQGAQLLILHQGVIAAARPPRENQPNWEGSGVWFPPESQHLRVSLGPDSLSKMPLGDAPWSGGRSSTLRRPWSMPVLDKSNLVQIHCKTPSLQKSMFTFLLAVTQQHDTTTAQNCKCDVLNYCCSFDWHAEWKL